MSTITPDTRQIIERIARSDGFRKLIDDDRAAVFTKRNAIRAAWDSDLPGLEAAIAKATKTARAAWDAVAVAEAAVQPLIREAREAHDAANYAAMLRDGRRMTTERELRQMADPRIDRLVTHVRELQQWARNSFATVAIREHPQMVSQSKAPTTPINNADEIGAAMAVLGQVLVELDALQTGAYGANLREQLQGMLNRAEAACAPLVTYRSGRRFRSYEVEE